MNHTIEVLEEAATSSQAFEQAKDRLAGQGWNVTYWHADQKMADGLWSLTVEVTEQKG